MKTFEVVLYLLVFSFVVLILSATLYGLVVYLSFKYVLAPLFGWPVLTYVDSIWLAVVISFFGGMMRGPTVTRNNS